jgi:His/Glu/Gln/Arg/opine family amino acid ABC transporter permease subunit
MVRSSFIVRNQELIKKLILVAVILIAFAFALDQPLNSKYVNLFTQAAWTTIKISIYAILIGFAIGIVIGLGRISRNFLINGTATVYVEILRGTPLIIQIFFVYFGLPSLGILIDPFSAATLALGLNSGAYQAEIIRGGVQSIPKGQMEAARSSGMSYLQAMRHIILPQGLRLSIPPMTNEYVTVIKDSSLAYTIGVVELTYVSNRLITIYYEPFTTLIFTALIYFTLTTFTSNIMRFVERKARIPGYMESD